MPNNHSMCRWLPFLGRCSCGWYLTKEELRFISTVGDTDEKQRVVEAHLNRPLAVGEYVKESWKLML